tara:strand:- start:419 stop:553 length:135 start_codon:yes stop_codon:yes gene_type:complete
MACGCKKKTPTPKQQEDKEKKVRAAMKALLDFRALKKNLKPDNS